MTDNNSLDTNMIPKSVCSNVGTLLGTSNKRIRSNKTDHNNYQVDESYTKSITGELKQKKDIKGKL